MTKNSQFLQRDYQPVNATRDTTGDGTAVVAAPANGERIRLIELTYWLVDPATENTVTLKLGDMTLPAVKLSAGRGSFAMGDYVLEPETAIYVNLSGTAAVGVFGRYLEATA